jgi:hypothetical protein
MNDTHNPKLVYEYILTGAYGYKRENREISSCEEATSKKLAILCFF